MNIIKVVGLAVVLLLAAGVCGTAAAEQVDINEIGDVTTGEMVTISGTTNIAPGNRLAVTVTPIGFAPTNKSAPGGGRHLGDGRRAEGERHCEYLGI